MRTRRTPAYFLIYTIVVTFLAMSKLSGQESDTRKKSTITEIAKPQKPTQTNDKETVESEHEGIGVESKKDTGSSHTLHPDAQWFPDAGLGLFIHWGISSVKGMNISWPMIPGRALAKKHLSAEERERIIRENDYN